ncbi:MAG: response regulator transcription factor [Ignavibacteriaceae bacterium]|nr:response regulator transcription factor [Ignavibacteriaceae bacterium]
MNKDKLDTKPKVLIVEDELESQKYFELVLKKKFRVDFCDTKRSMYDLLSKKNYDAIVMDISLKDGVNGLDLIKELKRSTSNINIPIICLSAHTFSEDRLKAEEAGADIYLTKPTKRQILINAIDELIAISLDEKKSA